MFVRRQSWLVTDSSLARWTQTRYLAACTSRRTWSALRRRYARRMLAMVWCCCCCSSCCYCFCVQAILRAHTPARSGPSCHCSFLSTSSSLTSSLSSALLSHLVLLRCLSSLFSFLPSPSSSTCHLSNRCLCPPPLPPTRLNDEFAILPLCIASFWCDRVHHTTTSVNRLLACSDWVAGGGAIETGRCADHVRSGSFGRSHHGRQHLIKKLGKTKQCGVR